MSTYKERAKEIFKENLSEELCISFGYENKEEFLNEAKILLNK